MIEYIFKNIEVVELESILDDYDSSGVLLKAYATIPLIGDGNPAGDGHSSSSGGGCDGGGAPSICP